MNQDNFFQDGSSTASAVYYVVGDILNPSRTIRLPPSYVREALDDLIHREDDGVTFPYGVPPKWVEAVKRLMLMGIEIEVQWSPDDVEPEDRPAHYRLLSLVVKTPEPLCPRCAQRQQSRRRRT